MKEKKNTISRSEAFTLEWKPWQMSTQKTVQMEGDAVHWEADVKLSGDGRRPGALTGGCEIE